MKWHFSSNTGASKAWLFEVSEQGELLFAVCDKGYWLFEVSEHGKLLFEVSSLGKLLFEVNEQGKLLFEVNEQGNCQCAIVVVVKNQVQGKWLFGGIYQNIGLL